MYNLLGRASEDDELNAMISINPERDEKPCFYIKKFKEGEKDFTYYSNEEGGISYCFENNVLTTIYLYNAFDKKFKPFKGEIPYNLSMNMTGGDIVSKLGEPNRKMGGAGKAEISIEYNFLGLEINFLAKIWDKNTPITYIALFQPKPSEKICSVCSKKDNLMMCGKCKLVSYCGLACQKCHWKAHKPFCY